MIDSRISWLFSEVPTHFIEAVFFRELKKKKKKKTFQKLCE